MSSDVPKEGLAKAIETDESAVPDPKTHPLLAHPRSFIECVFIAARAPDGPLVTIAVVSMFNTVRGSVKLASAKCNDLPLIDPNYLETGVDRYVARKGVNTLIRFAGSKVTVIGREILD